MRLIDADLLKQNCKITGEFENNFQCVDLITLGDVIDNQPTVEAKPVVNGKWITHYTQLGKYYECPICGNTGNCKKNFCSSCGCDMRGEKHD